MVRRGCGVCLYQKAGRVVACHITDARVGEGVCQGIGVGSGMPNTCKIIIGDLQTGAPEASVWSFCVEF